MTMVTQLLDQARRAKACFKSWNSNLDRFRYPDYYRGRLSAEEANLFLYNRLHSGVPVMAGKLGSVESRLLGEFCYGRGFSAKTRRLAHQNAGIFPVDDSSLASAAEELLASLHSLELLGCWPVEYQARLFMELPDLPARCELPDLEPFAYVMPWSQALLGQKVLVLHPFVNSLRHQWRRREELFPNRSVLPSFEPTFVGTPMTIKGAEYQDVSWQAALEQIWDQVQGLTFDVALIGCGAYSLPLAARIRLSGRTAIHLGGSLQLLFGVFGHRWERFSSQSALVNASWIRPLPSDRPLNYQAVENGCYW